MTTASDEPASPAPRLSFELQEGETVLGLRRRHWIYLWPRIVVMLVAAIAPPAVIGWLLSETGAFDGLARTAYLVAAGLYLLYWAVRIFLAWYQYQHDVWVITNQRLVDSRRSNPFNLQLSTADLVNVQDITVQRSGILRTILDFGDIICQTASERQQFTLSGIPDPRSTQSLIDRERDRERLRYRA